MPVNIHRVKSLGREPESIDVVMSCIGKQFSLLSLYLVNRRADKSRLRAIQDFSFSFPLNVRLSSRFSSSNNFHTCPIMTNHSPGRGLYTL